MNLTLYEINPAAQVRFRADPSDPLASVTFALSGFQTDALYDWFIDGKVLAHTVASPSGAIQYTYSGPWSSHEFAISKSSISPVTVQASFEYVIDGNLVTFTDKSYGPVTVWIWNFGDGFGSTKQNPRHEFQQGGLYIVSLTVYDLEAHSSVAQTRLTISFGPENPIEKTPTGWNIHLAKDFIISVSGVGLLVGGAIMYISAMYLPDVPIITRRGRKAIGALMFLAGLYFVIFLKGLQWPF